MSKINIDQELGDLIYRFKRLKKAIEEEQNDGLTPAQRAAVAAAERFTKQFAAEPLVKQAKQTAEELQAQQLAKTLQQRGVLSPFGDQRIKLQPTDQELFGRVVPDQKAAETAEKNWGNVMNNWLNEATKPLNARFRTAEEEQAYWDNIKVDGGSGGDSGY